MGGNDCCNHKVLEKLSSSRTNYYYKKESVLAKRKDFNRPLQSMQELAVTIIFYASSGIQKTCLHLTVLFSFDLFFFFPKLDSSTCEFYTCAVFYVLVPQLF